MSRTISIAPARAPEDVAEVKALFIAYQEWLGVDLCFQGFDEEMAAFPKGYDLLLLARVDGAPAGAVGVRPFRDTTCEMKRLYVPDGYQGLGIGRALCTDLLEASRAMGYTHMCLDTLDRLKPAITLYRTLGFAERTAYYDNPLEGVVYMEMAL